ncbi:MAG: hypothetical protein U0795_05905 [Pirellulales bacterium]
MNPANRFKSTEAVARRTFKVAITFVVLLTAASCSPLGPEQACSVLLPGGRPEIVYHRQRMHVNSEYAQSITIDLQGTKRNQPLLLNTGGVTAVNLHLLGDTYVTIEDAFGEYLLDLTDGELSLILRKDGRVFGGRFGDERALVEIETFDGDEASVAVRIDGVAASDVTGLFNEQQRIFVGTIEEVGDGIRFVPSKADGE